MTIFRRPSILAVPLLVAGAAAVLPSASAGAATTSVSVEAERMTLLSGRVVYYSDSAASGRRAVSMTRNGTVSAKLTTPQSQKLVLRLRGDQYQGAPKAVVRVDGRQVATLAVSATRWTDYSVKGSWAAGQHALQVSYVNDLSVSGVGDRNLRLDKVSFVGATSTPTGTTAPTPTGTTAPTPTGTTAPTPTGTTAPTPTGTTAPTPTGTTAPTPTGTTAPTPTGTATSSTTPASPDAAYEARIVELVNAERAKAGLRALTVSPCVDRYADEWSASMAASGQLVHRSDLGALMTACGARGVGENIAYGNVTADEMMAMWMGSTGHRANILNPSYTHIGVGIARTSTGRVYGTQNFLTI